MKALKPADKVGRKFQNPIPTTIGGFKMMLKLLPEYFSNKEERFPRKRLGPFKTDATLYLEPPASGLRITWFGHSSLLIEIDGVRVLTDPVWDERASPVSWAGPKRFYEPPLALGDLPAVDVVLISHDHYDHLGKQTIKHLSKLTEARWITSLGVGDSLRRFGVAAGKITELDWTDSVSISESLQITALPARHFSGRGITGRFESLWSSFVLKGPKHNIYYGADSGLWDGFAEIGQKFGPFDLTMLEIGAYNDHWRSIHMGPDGAVQAFSAMGSGGLLMPIHWGLFDLALHAWYQPITRMTELADDAGIRLWSPEPGVPTEFTGAEYKSGWWR